MGMHDDIACTAMSCPLCGSEMGWQSKDGPCTLETITVHELMDETSKPVFYANCDDCRVWVEVSVNRQTGRNPAQWAQYRKEREIVEARKKAFDEPAIGVSDPWNGPPTEEDYRKAREDPGINMDACWINGCTCDRPKPKRESPDP